MYKIDFKCLNSRLFAV